MIDTYEKNGIVYFKSPYRVKFAEWLSMHLDCDSIVRSTDVAYNVIDVLCYAKSKEYNDELFRVKNRDFPNDKLCVGLGSEEITSRI